VVEVVIDFEQCRFVGLAPQVSDCFTYGGCQILEVDQVVPVLLVHLQAELPAALEGVLALFAGAQELGLFSVLANSSPQHLSEYQIN
jgi:hypothetical protein